jgi:hypothetical protein
VLLDGDTAGSCDPDTDTTIGIASVAAVVAVAAESFDFVPIDFLEVAVAGLPLSCVIEIGIVFALFWPCGFGS